MTWHRATAALCLAAAMAGPALAQTMPQGRGRVSVGFYWVHQRLPTIDVPHLLEEGAATAIMKNVRESILDVATLSGRDLSLLTPGLGFSGSADVLLTVSQLDYGITDRLTVSAIWPYFNSARTRVKMTASHSLLAYNPNYDPRKAIAEGNLPVTVSRDAVTGTEGVQMLLTNVFGYRRFETWQSYGTGDPVLAFSYGFGTFPRTLRATVLGQLPIGNIADPDNPLAIPFSDGHAKFGGRLWYDDHEGKPFTFSAGLNWMAHLPDHPTLRIYRFAEVPISTAESKERVFRRQGQQLGVVMGVSRSFLDGLLRPGVMVGVEHSFQDTIRGSKPVEDYKALMSNSGRNVYSGEALLNVSTVERYLEGRFAIPAQFSLSLRSQVADRGLFNGIAQLQVSLTSATFF